MAAMAMALAACGSPQPATILTPVALVGCSSPDASIDAITLDAPPDAHLVDWSQPWVLHTITTAGVKGADGIDVQLVNGHTAAASGWEEGGGVTLSLDTGGEPWPTVRLAPTVTGYEDAKIGSLGGRIAVIGGSESNKLTLWLAPIAATDTQLLAASAWTTVQLAPLVPGYPAGGGNPADPLKLPGSHHFMQLGFADLDGDGTDDVLYGTRTEPSAIGYLRTPSEPWLVGAWPTATVISAAGWVMSLDARDINGDGRIDLLVTDRSSYGSPANWSLFGSRWLENTPTGWLNHTIAGPNGDGSPKFAATCALDGPGNPLVLVEVRGDNASPGSLRFPNSVYIRRNTSMTWNGAWSSYKLPLSDAYDLGTVQSAACADLNGDGVLDLVIGASYGHDDAETSYRDATATNLAWLDGADAWAMHPLLGLRGVKVDNTIVRDGRIYQTEQGDASTCAACTPVKPTTAAEQFGAFYLTPP